MTGFFDTRTDQAQLSNLECNATAAVKITHHYMGKMLRAGRKGCIVFTSSPAGFIPGPFAVMYGATKAFLSAFAGSIACEVGCKGIDVCCVHPSPVSSNFYNAVEHKIDTMESFKKAAVPPNQALAVRIFAAIGRVTFTDIGFTAQAMHIASAVLPFGSLAGIITMVAPYLPDYVTNDKGRGGKAE